MVYLCSIVLLIDNVVVEDINLYGLAGIYYLLIDIINILLLPNLFNK